MAPGFLLCTDLDRTLLPNGAAPESPGARELFRRFCEQIAPTLVYVSGRHPELVDEAIKLYAIPDPDYLISDVGTRIFSRRQNLYKPLQAWETAISADWRQTDKEGLALILGSAPGLRRQEKERENPCKLSYYVDLKKNSAQLAQSFAARLKHRGIAANVVWSIDHERNLGLLDVLPGSANKLKAIEFLIDYLPALPEQVLFAGDSGNDLDVFLSSINSVVVANAENDIKRQADLGVRQRRLADSLYIAGGNFLGLNGNYAAGILEGAAHFYPWVKEILQTSASG